MGEKIHKSDEEWKQQLTAEQYAVTRRQGTEPAFSGKYYHHKEKGLYRCICCGIPLFRSEDKFDSGTGWPSFTTPTMKDAIAEETDLDFGMRRVEVKCSTCEAHLGHVFEDGPQPTGLRYCINSLALKFQADPSSSGHSSE